MASHDVILAPEIPLIFLGVTAFILFAKSFIPIGCCESWTYVNCCCVIENGIFLSLKEPPLSISLLSMSVTYAQHFCMRSCDIVSPGGAYSPVRGLMPSAIDAI